MGAGYLERAGTMLRYAFRRILWSIPTLVATSFFLFFVTTLAPDPAALQGMRGVQGPGSAQPASSDPRIENGRRARFLDLPRFINPLPQDVAARARDAAAHVAAGDAQREAAERRLAELGGAALPYVLPELEAMAP